MDPFIAEIRIVGFNFAPRGWAQCDGQLMSIAQNTALFSLVGVNYGGDGRTTFGLPDLRGRVPLHAAQGAGLSPYQVGDLGGAATVPLSLQNMGPHDHQLQANNDRGSSNDPVGNRPTQEGSRNPVYAPMGTPKGMSGNLILPAGQSMAHNNYMPSLCLNYVIALQGIFPQRN